MSAARSSKFAIAGVLLIIALAAGVVACASNSPATTASTGTTGTSIGSSTTGSSTSSGDTTTTLPATLSDYDRELAKTAKIQQQLMAYLEGQQVSEDDPRLAVIFGLRARTQALTCRKALDQGDLELADSAMKDVYSTINLGRNVATDAVAQILADARATIETLGAPSDKPDEAAALLDQFIAQLAPLLAQATALIPTTTST
jgi:hypothetical protein